MRTRGLLLVWFVLLLGLIGSAQEPKDKPAEKFPAKEEVIELLKKEPITLQSWPTWRPRLLEWIHERPDTAPAFDAVRKFMVSQADLYRLQAEVLGFGEAHPLTALAPTLESYGLELPAPLDKDHLAWYLLGSAYLIQKTERISRPGELLRAEQGLRQSLKLDPKFAHAQLRLASVLIEADRLVPPQEPGKASPRFEEAVRAIDEAVKLNPKVALSAAFARAQAGDAAYDQHRFDDADKLLTKALEDDPGLAEKYLDETALAVLQNPRRNDKATMEGLKKLVQQFPKNTSAAATLGYWEAVTSEYDAARQEFTRCKSLGVEPSSVIPLAMVVTNADGLIRRARIASQSRQPDAGQRWAFASKQLGFLLEYWPNSEDLAIFYGEALLSDPTLTFEQTLPYLERLDARYPDKREIISYIATAHVGMKDWEGAQATLIRGQALGYSPSDLVSADSIRSVEHGLFRLRVERGFLWTIAAGLGFFVLVIGFMALSSKRDPAKPDQPTASPGLLSLSLNLLYGAFLFILLALLVVIGALVYLLLSGQELQFGLIMGIMVAIVLTWLCLEIFFVRPRPERLGIATKAEEIAPLAALADEVAKKVEAEPIDDIRLAPGAEVAIRPESPLLFGLMGSKRQVLSIGYAALKLLTVPEFAALLSQQFAHSRRSDSDTERQLARQLPCLDDCFAEMWQRGGAACYVNPIFLFLALYGKSFANLASGYRRQRELRADRTAGELYGSNVLSEGLLKVQADAVLYRARLQQLAAKLVAEDPELGNVYEAWDDLCGPEAEDNEYRKLAPADEDRSKARSKVREAKPRPNDFMPSLGERLTALEAVPQAEVAEPKLARELLANHEALEEQLTQLEIEALVKTTAKSPVKATGKKA